MMLHPPEYTQVPSALLGIIHKLKPTEFNVLTAACIFTFMWQSPVVEFTASDMTALRIAHPHHVSSALRSLTEKGYLIRTGHPRSGYRYRLNVED